MQARNEADALVYQAEKSLTTLGDKVPAADRSAIEAQITAVQDAVKHEDVNAIKTAASALQNATYALAQQMNANDDSAKAGGSYNPEGQPNQRPEDVVEGDFTEA